MFIITRENRARNKKVAKNEILIWIQFFFNSCDSSCYYLSVTIVKFWIYHQNSFQEKIKIKKSEKNIFKGLKKLNGEQKNNPTAIYSTHFYLQNDNSNYEIHQEVFEELHHKGGAKCKYEVFRKPPGTPKSRLAGLIGVRKGELVWSDTATYVGFCSVILLEAIGTISIFFQYLSFPSKIRRALPLTN